MLQKNETAKNSETVKIIAGSNWFDANVPTSSAITRYDISLCSEFVNRYSKLGIEFNLLK